MKIKAVLLSLITSLLTTGAMAYELFLTLKVDKKDDRLVHIVATDLGGKELGNLTLVARDRAFSGSIEIPDSIKIINLVMEGEVKGKIAPSRCKQTQEITLDSKSKSSSIGINLEGARLISTTCSITLKKMDEAFFSASI